MAKQTTIASKSSGDKLSATEFNMLNSYYNNSAKEADILQSFGIVGDGDADDTTALQDALNSGIKNIYIPARKTIKITSNVVCPDGVNIYGNRSKIISSENIVLLSLSGNNRLYEIDFEGRGNETASSLNIGIEIAGADVANYINNIRITGCNFNEFSGYAIRGKFVSNMLVENCYIDGVGYAGVGISSGKYVRVFLSNIKNISPGISGRAYGVFFSREENDSITLHPECQHCSVDYSTIENNEMWEGLDAHGGKDISFKNNLIKNCKQGIVVTTSANSSGVETFAPQDCRVSENTIYGNGTGIGININGVESAPSISNTVVSNFLQECGTQGNDISGAIKLNYTHSSLISGNNIKNCYANGIIISSGNKKIAINGNAIVDVQDSTYTTPSGIAVRANGNSGTITGNTMFRSNATLNTYVGERGIHIASGTSDNNFVQSSNDIDFVTPIVHL